MAFGLKQALPDQEPLFCISLMLADVVSTPASDLETAQAWKDHLPWTPASARRYLYGSHDVHRSPTTNFKDAYASTRELS